MNASLPHGELREHGAPHPDDATRLSGLTFMLGGEPYAIGIDHVREIVEYTGVTAVPMMPPVIRGIINLRGTVVPVVDLAARLGKSSQPPTRRTCIVIVELDDEQERHPMGLVVDSVLAVRQWLPSEREPAPGFGLNLPVDLVVGMCKADAGFVIWLDTAQILAHAELSALIERHATLPRAA